MGFDVCQKSPYSLLVDREVRDSGMRALAEVREVGRFLMCEHRGKLIIQQVGFDGSFTLENAILHQGCYARIFTSGAFDVGPKSLGFTMIIFIEHVPNE